MNENPRGHLDLLILAVLRGGPAHGYSIVAALKKRSGDVFEFPEGTVYPALQKLDRAGFLSSDLDTRSGRERRTYRLTRAGVAALKKKTEAWKRLVRAMNAVLARE